MTEAKPTRPLAGIRVLDLGMFWSGPFAGKLLGDAGAEVIKIESPSHPDNLRILARGVYPDGEPGERPWNRSGMINERNRNKLGLALELGTEEGRTILRELVAISDVVIENFSTKVLASWDLDYEHLRTLNPRIVLCSIYSQGGSGPESGFVSFGGTLEQVGGLTNLTGYPGELPGVFTVQLPDPLGGAIAVGLVVAALRQREHTGKGRHIDLSQRENVTTLLGDFLLDYQMNGRLGEPRGNRDPRFVPQGCYPCDGEDAWVTISVANDDEWGRLSRAIGQPGLIDDARFRTLLARQEHHDQLDEILASWTRSRGKHAATEILQNWGVRAGAVNNAADLYADPQLREHAFWEQVPDPDAGVHEYPGAPMRLERTPLESRVPTPTLGQHNDYVLGELLGKSGVEVADLAQRGIIGSEPTTAAKQGRL